MNATPPECLLRPDSAGRPTLFLSGDWTEGQAIPPTSLLTAALEEIDPPGPAGLDLSAVGDWDSQLPAFCLRWLNLCRTRGIDCQRGRHGSSVDLLLDLATATAPQEPRSGGPAGCQRRP